MENQEARKQIEAALGQFFLRYRYAFLVKVWDKIITHLAEEVIAIECEIEHENDEHFEPYTAIKCLETQGYGVISTDGHHGIPGKALAIILSRENEK